MHAYLMQHGEARPKDEDPDRPLTDAGRGDVQKMAGFCQQAGIALDAVWHSGKTRARQTAEIVAAGCRHGGGVTERDDLGPADDVEPLAEELTQAHGDTMVVGHLPFLARLAGLLLTGDADTQPVAFQKGGVACLSRDEGRWTLAWMVVPALIT